MKNSAANNNYIDLSFNPIIKFVKSKAMFKIKLKLTTGSFMFIYIDFVVKDPTSPILNELVNSTYLTNSFLNHVPIKNTHYIPIPIPSSKK